jgi:hypothetical protein
MEINAAQSSSMKFRCRMFKKDFYNGKGCLNICTIAFVFPSAPTSAGFAHPAFMPAHFDTSISSFSWATSSHIEYNLHGPVSQYSPPWPMPYKPNQYNTHKSKI